MVAFPAIKKRLEVALHSLRQNDAFLLEVRVGERAVAGRLQSHLAPLFPGLSVDAEYNRHGIDPKRVPLGPPCHDVLKDDALVIPDLIVHNRGDDEQNELVIEIKYDDCAPEELRCDRAKLAAMKGEFGYRRSALLILPFGPDCTGKPISVEWDGGIDRSAVV